MTANSLPHRWPSNELTPFELLNNGKDVTKCHLGFITGTSYLSYCLASWPHRRRGDSLTLCWQRYGRRVGRVQCKETASPDAEVYIIAFAATRRALSYCSTARVPTFAGSSSKQNCSRAVWVGLFASPSGSGMYDKIRPLIVCSSTAIFICFTSDF